MRTIERSFDFGFWILDRGLPGNPKSAIQNPKSASRRAFTLLEGLIASVILAVGVVGVASTLAASASQARALATDTTAQMLARELMEEVAARPFNPPGGVGAASYKAGNTNRATYDNLADFDGYGDSTPLRSLNGDIINTGDGVIYTRAVTVEFRNTPGGPKVLSGDFAMVTVVVKANLGRSITMSRLVTNVNLVR
jgi:type II secretory pathway pseudopilin PulG